MAYKRSKSDELLQHGNNNVQNEQKMIFSRKNQKQKEWNEAACLRRIFIQIFHSFLHFVLFVLYCIIFFVLSQTESWMLFSMGFSLCSLLNHKCFSILKWAKESPKTMRIDLIRLFFFYFTICGLDGNADKATTIRYRARPFCFCSWWVFFSFVIGLHFCHEAPCIQMETVHCTLRFPIVLFSHLQNILMSKSNF